MNRNDCYACFVTALLFNKNIRSEESRTEKDDPTKPFKCPHRGCNKAFAKQKYVRQHLQRHGPRTHMCTRCNKAFDDSSKLKRHNLIHSKEKPHVCPVDGCGKSFSVYYNMKVHLGTHSSNGEWQICCDASLIEKMHEFYDRRLNRYSAHNVYNIV
ncbi:Transcriptional repressor protein YY1 [Trichinella pseudospiralis]|uniref:Transcriptional repressor protein YY1 n=1 Tax=Trichinella pseudospiralis TaxID=6337 RepID=A0A0V1IS65_TRIPS|nr:Transcriptional repressor protein YY1 [Trichinella pseudospiralis]KRZ25511.1 Transcriptional repressor protein YY1 [Trichinella pseudospiralis]